MGPDTRVRVTRVRSIGGEGSRETGRGDDGEMAPDGGGTGASRLRPGQRVAKAAALAQEEEKRNEKGVELGSCVQRALCAYVCCACA